MTKCPYCAYETPEPDDGDPGIRAWQEVAHMQLEHLDIVEERLEKRGILYMSPRFREDNT